MLELLALPYHASGVLSIRYNKGVKHIGSHIALKPQKKEGATRLAKAQPRRTERGELMEYFRDRLNPTRVRDGYPPLTLARMGKVLELIPTKDLYYLKSVCSQASDFSKKFWWEVSPKKHQKVNEQK